MKTMYLVLIAVIFLVFFWFIKTDTKDRKARKDAIRIEATVKKVRCKQRLKGDNSLIKINYNSKEYAVFFEDEKKCLQYKANQKVIAYYSKMYDKLFLEL